MVVHKFDYAFSAVNDLHVELVEDQTTGKERVGCVRVHDEPLEPTPRFWVSLFARYGFNKAFFNYFSHAEVFNRISEVEPNDRMRVCIERGEDHNGNPTNRLMAVSNPRRPVVVHDDLMAMLERYNGYQINYSNGIVESTHSPRTAHRFEVLGDSFENKFIMSTPIDGYGSPNLYLSLLRAACTNGLVAYAKTFRSSLSLGKAADDVGPSLTRALDGFNHDEGYAALRSRIESAGNSWCSVYESQTLYKLLVKLHSDELLNVNDQQVPKGTNIADLLTTKKDTKRRLGDADPVGSPILTAFHRMAGDTCEEYGLANLDALSAKRQRTLPVRCTVYDALNFATEAATHYASSAGARQLQAWVGTRISDEYDMEGTKKKFGDFSDFLIDSKMGSGMTGSSNATVRN